MKLLNHLISPTASDLALAMFDLSPASDPALAMFDLYPAVFDLSPIPVVEGHPSSF